MWAKDADPGGTDASMSPYDYGAFIVDSRDGQSLEDVVGAGADVYWNAPRHLRVDSFGYPSEEPYDGKSQFTCESPTTDFHEAGWPEPDMLWMGCTMTGVRLGRVVHGSRRARVPGQQLLLAVTTRTARTMTGPYLGDVAKEMYDSL